MTDELISLEEIDLLEEDWKESCEMAIASGDAEKDDVDSRNEKQQRLFKTARAAHEWKAKYNARKVEVAAIVEENESLKREKKWSYENAAQAAALSAENEKLREQLRVAREVLQIVRHEQRFNSAGWCRQVIDACRALGDPE